jgi:hypothetical protein
VVTIPVPVQGEIYVRYGSPGGVQIQSEFRSQETLPAPAAPPAPVAPAPPRVVPAPDQAPATTAAPAVRTSGLSDEEALRAIIREELNAVRPSPQAAAPNTAPAPVAAAPAPREMSSAMELELLERRLAERIDTVLDTRLQGLESRPAEPQTTFVLADGTPATVVQVTEPEKPFGWHPSGFHVYTGANVDEPTQFMTGFRLDLGPLGPESRLHFVPEIGLGFGSETTSFLAAANLKWSLRSVNQEGTWTPYAYAGAGILGYTQEAADRTSQEGVLNIGYGVTVNFGALTAFAEHQAIDLFDLNRLLTGVQWSLGS